MLFPPDEKLTRTSDCTRPETFVIETTGTEDKIDSLLEVLRPYGVIEMVRTGRVEMARGTAQPVTVGPSRGIGDGPTRSKEGGALSVYRACNAKALAESCPVRPYIVRRSGACDRHDN